MTKKLSLESILESDALQHNQELKFNVAQKLPHYFQTFIKQIKADQYDAAIQTLGGLIGAAQETQKQLTVTLQKNPQIKQQGNQAPQMPGQKNISNKEI